MGKDMETKSGQEKFLWSNAMTDDMIDIICSDKIMKKIFFSETKNFPPIQNFLKG